METSAHTWEPGILIHPLAVTPLPVSHSGVAADSVTFDLVHTFMPSITTFLPPVEIKSDTHCFTEETYNPDQIKMGCLFTSCAA